MTTLNKPVVANLDFDDIKKDIIDHFKDSNDFKDYNFQGSALNTLIDILAYNTHLNALTANFSINEMFINTAQKRENLVSIAKGMNYVPTSTTASRVDVTIDVPRLGSERSFIIPVGTTLTATNGNTSFTFNLIQDYIAQFLSNETSKQLKMTFYQGKSLTERFIQNNLNLEFPTFDLLNGDVDTQTISTRVNDVKYTMLNPENESISNIDSSSAIFFVEEISNKKHRIKLGNGVIGRKVNVGDEVVVSYLTSAGENANNISTFSLSVAGRSDISIVSNNNSYGGSSIETERSIKDNAPHWFQSQYRAVTSNDYETIIKKNYPDIQAINAYGGEDVGKPGKVFITIKPKVGDKLSNAAKLHIENNIIKKFNIVNIKPEILDPQYIELLLNTTVIYDNGRLTSNESSLKSKIFSLFTSFNNNRLSSFRKSFFEQNLAEEIKLLDKSIVSINTRTSLRYNATVTNNKLNKYQIRFNNPLYHPLLGFNSNKGGILSTNDFKRIGKSFTSGFDDDGKGNIRLFDNLDNVKVYSNNKAGTIDYGSGILDIKDFDPVDGNINFTVVPDSFDVLSLNEYILRISLDSSIINIVEKDNIQLINLLNKSRSV